MDCRTQVKRLSNEAIWIIVGQGFAVAGGLATVRLLTELLDPVEYGAYALGMTVVLMINQTLLGPISNGIVRFYSAAAEKTEILSYIDAVRRSLICTILVLFAAISLIIACSYHTKFHGARHLAIAATLFATIAGLNSALNGIQNAARNRVVVAFHQGVDGWLRLATATIAAGLLGTSSSSIFLGFAVGGVLVLTSQLHALRRKISGNPPADKATSDYWLARIINFSWPISIFGIFTWLHLSSDRWALGMFKTTDELGRYAALSQIGSYPAQVATILVMQLAVPVIYGRAGAGDDPTRSAEVKKIGHVITISAILLTLAAVAVSAKYHYQIFRFAASHEYSSVSHLLPWVILAAGLSSAGQVLSVSVSAQKENIALLAPKIGSAILGLVLNFIGAYYYGTAGVVYASVVFAVTFLISTFIVEQRPSPKLFPTC